MPTVELKPRPPHRRLVYAALTVITAAFVPSAVTVSVILRENPTTAAAVLALAVIMGGHAGALFALRETHRWVRLFGLAAVVVAAQLLVLAVSHREGLLQSAGGRAIAAVWVWTVYAVPFALWALRGWKAVRAAGARR